MSSIMKVSDVGVLVNVQIFMTCRSITYSK